MVVSVKEILQGMIAESLGSATAAHEDDLQEALITFRNKAYPKFGTVVIMAGGAGSGKGFILNKLVGVEGKVFDVDALKGLVLKSKGIAAKVKAEFGVDVKEMNLKRPEDVARLHEIVSDYLNLPNKNQAAFVSSVITAAPDRKPNIVFDVTLKSLSQLDRFCRLAKDVLGYDEKNIHIVWVVNDIEIAAAQNQKRDRTVPTEILVATHRGTSQTMAEIVNMGTTLKKYMDGDIVLAFSRAEIGLKGFDKSTLKNQGETDANVEFSGSKGAGSIFKSKAADKRAGMYVKDANYVKIKEAGKPVMSLDSIDKDLKAKIKRYVPANLEWN